MESKFTKNSGKIDQRVIRTRASIMNAYKTLLSTTDIKKITVSALARKAEIDRKTFYLHYRSIEHLTDCMTTQIMEEVVETVKREISDTDSVQVLVHAVLEEVNTIMTRDINLYSKIAEYFSLEVVIQLMTGLVESVLENTNVTVKTSSKTKSMMKFRFYVAGAIALYGEWLRSDHQTPIEEVSKTIEEAINLPPVETWAEFSTEDFIS